MTTELAARLDELKRKQIIAGWQAGGGPNYGLSKEPLKAKIFPSDGGPASSYASDAELATAVAVLEEFGALALGFAAPK
jgi:hypothetical protein